jgi:hypothetical protein
VAVRLGCVGGTAAIAFGAGGDEFLNGLLGVRHSVVLFLVGGAGTAFDGVPELFAVFDAGDAAETDETDGTDKFEAELLLVLTGDDKEVPPGLGLSGKTITGIDAPVFGVPGVNWRFVNPLVPVVFEFELLCDALGAF